MIKNKDLNQVKAIYRNLRSSPRKINNILKSIRGKNANVAMRDLEFTDKRVANEIKKTLKSAIANAENNNQLDIDNLIVKDKLEALCRELQKHNKSIKVILSQF